MDADDRRSRSHRDRARRTLALLVASTALLASATAAHAALVWDPPVAISAGGQDAAVPQVAVDPAGDAIAVWYRFAGHAAHIESAAKAPAGPWAAPQQLPSGADPYGPQVGLDAHGNATSTWYESGATDFVESAARPAGGGWGGAQQLAPGDEPRIAVNAAGDAVAVWYRFDGAVNVIEAATRPAGGAWSGPQQVSLPGVDSYGPQVAIDGAGGATVVWYRLVGEVGTVQAATRPAGGGWSSPQDISLAGQDAEAPSVAVDPAGDATAVWYARGGSSNLVQAATRSGAGGWSAPEQLSADGGDAAAPQVAIDGQGNATAVWSRFNGSVDVIQSAARLAGGTWSGAQDISVAGQSADEPQVAVDPAGDAAAVWYRFNGNAYVIEGATRPPGGAWSAPQQLSATGDAFGPQVGLSAQGGPVAVWYRSGGGDVIEATGPPGSGSGAGSGGAGGTTGTGTGPSASAPVISSLRIRPPRFRTARSGPTAAAAAGATVSYRDSVTATTTFSIRRLPTHPRCRRRLHARKRCVVRGRVVGSFKRHDRAGANRFRFSGRVRRRPLAPGPYLLVASPRDALGRVGAARQVRFKIVR